MLVFQFVRIAKCEDPLHVVEAFLAVLVGLSFGVACAYQVVVADGTREFFGDAFAD